MADAIHCPECGHEQESSDELAGLWCRCAVCRAAVYVSARVPVQAAATIESKAIDAPDDVPWHGLPEDVPGEESPPADPPNEEVDPELEFSTRWQDRMLPGTVPLPFLRKRGRLPAWLRGTLLILFVSMLIIPAWLFARWLNVPRLGTARLLLPDHTESILIVDFESLRKSPIYWQLLKSAPPQVAREISRFPVPPENISRLILAEAADGSVLIIFQAKEPLRGDQVKQRIKANNLVQEEVGRYVAHTDARGHALCLVQSDLIVTGQLSTLRQVLLRADPPQLSAEMREGLDGLDLQRTAVLLATPKERPGMGLPGAARVLVNMDVTDGVVVDLAVDCRQAKEAESLSASITDLLAREWPKADQNAAGAWEVLANGNSVEAHIRVEAEALLTAIRRRLAP